MASQCSKCLCQENWQDHRPQVWYKSSLHRIHSTRVHRLTSSKLYNNNSNQYPNMWPIRLLRSSTSTPKLSSNSIYSNIWLGWSRKTLQHKRSSLLSNNRTRKTPLATWCSYHSTRRHAWIMRAITIHYSSRQRPVSLPLDTSHCLKTLRFSSSISVAKTSTRTVFPMIKLRRPPKGNKNLPPPESQKIKCLTNQLCKLSKRARKKRKRSSATRHLWIKTMKKLRSPRMMARKMPRCSLMRRRRQR